MLCDTILIFCLLFVVPMLAVLIFVVTCKMKVDTKIVPPNYKQKDECKELSDRELREVFLNAYINSDCCFWVKVVSLPKSFKIGNVYFDKCIDSSWSCQTFLSHIVIGREVYDNGYTIIAQEWYSSCRITNKDLLNYILDNLDKVEEVKQ